MADTDPSRQQRRAAARAEREQLEAATARASVRRQRIGILSAVIAVAVVVIAIIAFSGNDSGSSKPVAKVQGDVVTGQTQTNTLLAGIPQSGRFLGSPTAPVTMTEFADVQCPFCREYTENALPTVIRDYVRTGKVRLEFRSLPILAQDDSSDSIKGAKMLAAAAQKNKLWTVLELLYANQGDEQSGWLKDPLAESIYKAAGLAPSTALDAQKSAGLNASLKEDQDLADTNSLNSTPSFLLGTTGQTPKQLQIKDLTGSFFSSALNTALTGAGK